MKLFRLVILMIVVAVIYTVTGFANQHEGIATAILFGMVASDTAMQTVKRGFKQYAAFELLTGFATAPGAAFTNIAGGDFTAGNTTIRNFEPGSSAWMINIWGKFQAAGISKVISPRMHDNVQNIRHRIILGQVYPLMSNGAAQPLQTQDTVNVQVQGSANAGDIEIFHMLNYYQNLPGSNARLIDEKLLDSLIRNILTVEISITAGTAGGWSGAAALNSSFDLLKANTSYAILGGRVSAIVGAVGIRGADFGNLRLGFPGNAADGSVNSNFFVDLTRQYAIPMIPVFNSANKAGILIDVTNDENALSPVVTLNLAELAG